ncbi:hypothetical protein [Streptomyces sp. NBC_00140]|uniref:hypothetical protein n=1 Tax=Streptomyces sp. NBC_00140 TaxID=2975664 RepID=UPI00224E5D0D|nr:hypothetical protein [Streptomyces sp. NBC_00140]MCX5336877.1 hypothetical protein [Streptomyces sp. NBC_00140]
MRWLMTLGERTRPDVPTFAECPGPMDARAVALVSDFGQLFPILLEWRRSLGSELTAYAGQVEADDIENLPPAVIEDWGPDQLRLDTMPGGYVKVSDYRDDQAQTALPSGAHMLMRS